MPSLRDIFDNSKAPVVFTKAERLFEAVFPALAIGAAALGFAYAAAPKSPNFDRTLSVVQEDEPVKCQASSSPSGNVRVTGHDCNGFKFDTMHYPQRRMAHR